MITRLLALAGAVAMVVVAIVVRNNIDDEEPARGLICITEAADACERVDGDVAVEPAGVTADRLIREPSPRLDGWLTTEPWPHIVDEARQRAGLAPLFSVGGTIARARAGVVVWRDRAAVLSRACGETLDWACFGTAAQREKWSALGGREEWGLVKIGVDDPANTASGLTVLGSVAAALGGGPAVSSTDLRDHEAFQRWLSAVTRSSTGRAQVEAMLSAGPSVQDAAFGLESEIEPLVANSARRNEVVVLYPAPVSTANLVLATIGSPAYLQAMITPPRGWTARDAGPLPAPGVLDYLRGAWREAAR